ncbi:MAG: hypothetical protein DWQ01_20730 [Planctomycetota bacterium]|nr:MAG: hypothetical protein DWQ01_20730 [Planctomycetota bacterium]
MVNREERKQERQRRLLEAQRLAKQERRRLWIMAMGLVLVVGMAVTIQQSLSKGEEEGPAEPNETLESMVAQPPVQPELLEEVADADEIDRLKIEPGPFRHLSQMAHLLQTGHLRALGNPELPLEQVEQNPESYRGKAFRVRGLLQATRILTRSPGAPEERWSWLQTDQGQDVFFVSLRTDEGVFPGSFVKGDGFFFKLYRQTLDGKILTAPLLIGRELLRSYRLLEPSQEIDLAALADIETPEIGTQQGPQQTPYWSLLNVAHHLGQDPAALEQRFENVPQLTLSRLTELAAQPAAFRGQPIILAGMVSDHQVMEAGENPVRLEFTTSIWLRNLAWGDHLVHVVAPGRFPDSREKGGSQEFQYLGWFMQLESYFDTTNRPRRAPLFIVAGGRWMDVKAPSWIGETMLGFLAAAIVLTLVMIVLIRQDRKRTAQMNRKLEERRRQRREGERPS